jgi:hypothetical protein
VYRARPSSATATPPMTTPVSRACSNQRSRAITASRKGRTGELADCAAEPLPAVPDLGFRRPRIGFATLPPASELGIERYKGHQVRPPVRDRRAPPLMPLNAFEGSPTAQPRAHGRPAGSSGRRRQNFTRHVYILPPRSDWQRALRPERKQSVTITG